MSTINPLNSVPADLTGVAATLSLSASTSSSASSAPATSNASPSQDQTTSATQPPQQATSAQRLVIQAGAQTGVFVYTILDRLTGQILVQIPREEVIKLANRPDYSAGTVIDTKA
jgi:flagellar protein FlaG